MVSMLKMLEDLDIDISDIKEDDELKLDEIKIDDIPEEQRPLVKALLADREKSINEISRRDLMLQTMDKAIKAVPKQEPVKKEEEKDDTFDKDDPKDQMILKMQEQITALMKSGTVDEEKDFDNRLVAFAKENPDIVRVANEMDELRSEHPTLNKDLPNLFKLAKGVAEGRKTSKKVTEKPGVSNSNVIPIVDSKTIAEAFAEAQKSQAS